MIDENLKKKLKFFWWGFNIKTEGMSFFVVVPILLWYVWANIQLDDAQMELFFVKIVPFGFTGALGLVLLWNYIVLIPVLRYFRKLVKGKPVSAEEYESARKRFYRLPLLHAVGAFFRWIFCLGMNIVPFTILSNSKIHQVVNMWLGVGICAILGIVSYLSITENMIQALIDDGLFSEQSKKDYSIRVGLLTRLYLMVLSSVYLAIAVMFTFFYTTVENSGISTMDMYIKVAIWIFFAIVVGIISPIFFNRALQKKIELVVQFLARIGSGDLTGRAHNIAVYDEISEINHDVDDMRTKLKTARDELLELNLNLENKVRERTEELQSANEELEAMNTNLVRINEELESAERIRRLDLAMAANVQGTFLSKTAPVSDEYDIAFMFRPMSEVSGDFYDFYSRGDTLNGLGIFDVSGHGISSGLITLLAKSIIERNFHASADVRLNQVIDRINAELIDQIGHLDNYLTGILLRFASSGIEYVNSGHNDMLYRSGVTKNVQKILNKEGESPRGYFLGIPMMAEKFYSLTIKINSGDCLLLYTDGLNESKNEAGTPYDENGVIRALQEAPGGSAREVLDYIINDFYTFLEREDKLGDDLTVVVVKKK